MSDISRILSILLVASLTFACSTTKELSLVVSEPSPVTITNEIKTIGIIDATKPSLEKRKKKVGLAEVAVQDEKWLRINGTEASMEGLFDALLKDNRIDKVVLIQRANIAQSLSDESLNADTWQEIDALCAELGVDAIFALAHFEVDTKLKVKKTNVTQNDLLRMQQLRRGQEITMETLIENGWRIFDPNNKVLLDEIVTNDAMVTTSKGSNVYKAFENMGNRRQNAIAFSKKTGVSYGKRLWPTERLLKRKYFAKGNPDLTKTNELIEKGNIAQAIQKLKHLVTKTNATIGSRASYNLAVLHEYQGNLAKAIQWTEKSIAIKRNGFNTTYLKNLQKRQTKNLLAQQQFQAVGMLE